uniref:Zn(2)-C6 fungal-type domain-containing protein n=1 Tax=Bionectria ochroleuca TaxID=29856 RepID=A0A8H7K7E9_BIOOC
MDNSTSAPSANDTSADFSSARLRRRRQKFARSRNGCFTCKQRKVKCDELRPTCSHCERLNIECKWYGARRSSIGASDEGNATRTPESSLSAGLDKASYLPSHPSQVPQGFHQEIDYSGSFWEESDVWQQMFMDVEGAINSENHMMQTTYNNQTQNDHVPLASRPRRAVLEDECEGGRAESSALSAKSPASSNRTQETIPQDSSDNQGLIDYFAHSVTPPILSEVEAQRNWITMRKVLIKMAEESRMVRWAVLAFANAILCLRNNDWRTSKQHHYHNAAAEIAQLFPPKATELVAQHSRQRENMFATLFFLSYIDILEARVETARSHLQKAYDLFQRGKSERFAPMEKQLLLWIRLLDARTVAAGGEGLFLSKDDEEILVFQTSPASFGGDDGDSDKDELDDSDVDDILFQALYQPGIIFFQKVQSFMGHIAKIDPWHRSRGTVEDETEVMSTAAVIAANLRDLYEQRPVLMDCAVAGKLTTKHISASLALPLTRAFRTYLSNYYASKIHLHRVAYKTFPLTAEAREAMDQIRGLAKLIASSLEGEGGPLPINMLWPLLLLGTEEQDLRERSWIKDQILRMEKVAGNARITAQVLEEVQARQDASKSRVDIGTVMREIFNKRFAVV